MSQKKGGGKLSDRVKSLLTLSTLAGIPSSLATIRKFVSAIDWREAQAEIAGEPNRKVAIIGMPNSGKSTLFNTLQGQYLSFASPEAGATKEFVRGAFGPFALIDTPGHLPEMQRQAIDEASAVLYLLDATEGIRQRDLDVIQQLRDGEKPFVVALNKTDLIAGDTDELAARAAARLHITDVTPISAQTGENIAEELIPAIINTSPEAALLLGRLLPQYRRRAANKLVRTATLISLAAGPYALGQVAIEYFENGKQLSRKQINEIFNRYYRRYREELAPLGAAVTDPPLLPPATESLEAELD